jgi:hypothetical protein
MEVNIKANNNDSAVVVVSVPEGAHMDAATAGDIAGVELEISRASLRNLERRSERKAALTLTFDMSPTTMQALAHLLVDALGWPAPETRIVNTHATDEQRLDAIARELDGVEWSPDTLDVIANLIRASGRQVRDIEDMPEEDS